MPRATSSGSTSAPWIPLRDDYFETPLLSQKESAYLVRKSCEAAQEVVERARSSGGPIQWRHVEKYRDVQLYAGFSRGTYSSEPTSMCGVTSVSGSIKEIAALFDLPTTRAMKEFSRSHRDLFFDSVVLYTLSPRTREKPLHQVTAKWVATKCPKGMDDRDYCYLECQDKFMDSTGRKGWVLCLHSIKLPGCDELSREFGFVRGSFYHSGIVVVEADRPGYVDIIHMLQINLKNNTKVPPSYLRERVAWISRLKGILRVKRLNEQRYLSDLELVPKKYRSRCHVCQDSFSLLLLRKMNCRKCGEVVCGACSKEFDVTNAKFLETIKLRICMHCYQVIAAGQSPNVLEQPRASTSLSLLGYHEDNHRASIITEALPGERLGHNPYSTNREGPTKIFLQSMRHHRAVDRRSSRRTRETDTGQRMQSRAPYPEALNTDPVAGVRRSSRGYHGGDAQSVSAPGGYGGGYDYDSRSLFDKPRDIRGTVIGYASAAPPPSFPVASPPAREDPPAPPPPASLFDRRSSRIKQDDMDLRRIEEYHRESTKQSALPTTSPRLTSRLSTRDSRGAFKIPHSLYDYSSLDPDAAKPEPPTSPVRDRGNSTSSVSSTGSIDIDSYEVGKAKAARGARKTTASIDESYHDVKNMVRAYSNADDEDTEGSIGSGDDESDFVSRANAQSQTSVARSPSAYYDHEEETKSHEFESTPALPPPPPSAVAATQDALMESGHTDVVDVPFHRRNFNDSDLSSATTTDCDTRYLDSEMRQFHGQPFYMRDASEDRSTIDFSRAHNGFGRGGSTEYSEKSVLRDSDVNRDSESPPPHAAMKTSPMKPASMVDRPPLYGRPTRKEPGTVAASRATETQPGAARMQLTDASILSRDSVSQPPFENFSGSLVSSVPSAHSNVDLAFNSSVRSPQLKPYATSMVSAARRSMDESSSDSPRLSDMVEPQTPPPPRRPPPPPPPYLPSRFQTRASETAIPLVDSEFTMKSNELDRESLSGAKPAEETTAKKAMPAKVDPASASNNQNEVDEIDDVDFEELLQISVSNEDDGARQQSIRRYGALQRSHTFDVANASAGHYGDVDDSSESEDEEPDLLSARRVYRKFNSSKRLVKVAGAAKNPDVQRTFAQIQEGINMMSDSGDDSGSESID